MDWFVRHLFGDRVYIEILPGIAMVCWHEAVVTTSGMTFVVERFSILCKWFPW